MKEILIVKCEKEGIINTEGILKGSKRLIKKDENGN